MVSGSYAEKTEYLEIMYMTEIKQAYSFGKIIYILGKDWN